MRRSEPSPATRERVATNGSGVRAVRLALALLLFPSLALARPPDARLTLEAAGVDRIVPTGAPPSEVAAWLRESLHARESVAG